MRRAASMSGWILAAPGGASILARSAATAERRAARAASAPSARSWRSLTRVAIMCWSCASRAASCSFLIMPSRRRAARRSLRASTRFFSSFIDTSRELMHAMHHSSPEWLPWLQKLPPPELCELGVRSAPSPTSDPRPVVSGMASANVSLSPAAAPGDLMGLGGLIPGCRSGGVRGARVFRQRALAHHVFLASKKEGGAGTRAPSGCGRISCSRKRRGSAKGTECSFPRAATGG
mmetsp:Transcript_12478/g.39492  ORF Transcript_12478/g.39492 Transcript_12478/m.39492 type:complete len:234 (+) Transcript_12478:904-1605(+)